MNAEQYMRRLQWQIADLYVNHQLLSEVYWDHGRGARWLIGKPGTGNMLSEIIAGVHGSLVVHGDCDTSRFAYYSDHRDAWNRLCWMGFCTDVGYYVNQKAAIGMSRSATYTREYNEEVARHDLRQYIRELKQEPDWRTDRAELIEVIQEALEIATESHHELWDFLGHRDKGWDLWEHRFGEVISQSVVVGHLALQRCAYLLLDKYGDAGPPECRPPTPAQPQEVAHA